MSHKIRLVSYDSWPAFKADFIQDLTGETSLERNRYVFRGQRCATWQLTPTFDRVYRHLRLEDRPSLAQKLLDYFREYLDEFQPSTTETRPLTESVQLMALAQHYGLPTRLLDWSRSPYVAAFFAFSDLLVTGPGDDDSHVAVWALDTSSRIWGADCGVSLVNVPRHTDERIRNQGGLFTLSTVAVSSLEDHHESMDPKDPALVRFVLPQSEAQTAMEDLHMMAIHHARLFPGFEGCVQAAQCRLAPDLSDQLIRQ